MRIQILIGFGSEMAHKNLDCTPSAHNSKFLESSLKKYEKITIMNNNYDKSIRRFCSKTQSKRISIHVRRHINRRRAMPLCYSLQLSRRLDFFLLLVTMLVDQSPTTSPYIEALFLVDQATRLPFTGRIKEGSPADGGTEDEALDGHQQQRDVHCAQQPRHYAR